TLERQTVIDAEVELARRFDLIVPHDFLIGFNYRRKEALTQNFLGRFARENHFGLFVQDSIEPLDWLRIVGSLRVDRNPQLANLQFAPRGAVIMRLNENSAVRASIGSAFRTPTMSNAYVEIDTQPHAPM